MYLAVRSPANLGMDLRLPRRARRRLQMGNGSPAGCVSDLTPYAAPGCSLVFNPTTGMPCQVRAWCTTQDGMAKQWATPSPPWTGGWDIHQLDAQAAQSAAAAAAQQVSYGMTVLPETAAVLQITGQPIPVPAAPAPSPAPAAATPLAPVPDASLPAVLSPITVAENWFSESTSLFGFTIANWMLAAGAAGAAFLLLKKGRR